MDLAERNRLVEQYRHFVRFMARKLMRTVPAVRRIGTMDDIVSEGMFGLIRAVELYDPKHTSRAKFMSYAGRAIYNRLVQLAKSEGMIHLPWYIVDEIAEADEAGRWVHNSLKHRRARAAHRCARLTKDNEKSEDLKFPRLEPEEAFDPEILYRVLGKLDPRDRELVMDYWGLNGRERQNTRELAPRYGVTYQQICNRLAKLKARLRRDIEWELELEAAPR